MTIDNSTRTYKRTNTRENFALKDFRNALDTAAATHENTDAFKELSWRLQGKRKGWL